MDAVLYAMLKNKITEIRQKLLNVVENATDMNSSIAQNTNNIEKKLDKNQGASNSGKITGINESGDIVPMFPQGVTYNEDTQCLEYGADEKLNLNAGIQLDDTLSKVGYAADAASVGDLKGDIDGLSLIEGIETSLSFSGTPNRQNIKNPQNYYVFNKILKANSAVVLFRINLIKEIDNLLMAIFDTTGRKIAEYELGSGTIGENTFYPNMSVVNCDYYVGFNSVISFGGTGEDCEYFYVTSNVFNPTDTPSIAKFAFDLYTQTFDKIGEVNEKIGEVNEKIGEVFNSIDFEESSSWVNVASSLLAIPTDINGYVTSVRLSSNITGYQTVSIFNWDGIIVSKSAFELVSSDDVYFENGKANCKISIKKGQYLAITSIERDKTVTKWLDGYIGTPFIYMQSLIDGVPETVLDYRNSSVAIQYTVTSDGFNLKMEEIRDKIMEYDKMKLKGSVIFLGGDSRSSDDYDFYGNKLREKTNANVLVQGASGWMAKHIASNAYFSRLQNNKNHDYAIFLVGGNDVGANGTVGTFDVNSINGKNGEPVVEESDISRDFFTGSGSEPNYNDGNHQSDYFIVAVDHIIRKYKSMFYDWKSLNNGHKPKLIICTDIPQKRSGGTLSWNLKENWERKRNAIIECCEKNNVACLDLYTLCNFDMSYEPEWSAPTDKVNNNGLYFMDGLHPNEYGIDIITSLEVDMLRKYITIK